MIVNEPKTIGGEQWTGEIRLSHHRPEHDVWSRLLCDKMTYNATSLYGNLCVMIWTLEITNK